MNHPQAMKWQRFGTAQADLAAIPGAPQRLPEWVELINDNAVAVTATLVSVSGSSVAFLTPANTSVFAPMSPRGFGSGAITVGWRGARDL